ncbi:MAG: hypothetical protein O3A84_14770 [Proteobacteria bacterium]|nr:hypothetical protein [Pseudomonadota bacterium]
MARHITAGAGTDDRIDVSDFAFADFAALLAAADDSGGSSDTVITLDSDDSITPFGIRNADLHADDFLL